MVRVLDLLEAAPIDQPPRSGADRAQVTTARVAEVSADGTIVSVSILGSAPIPLPATANVWAGVQTAHVLMDPGTGRPVHVLGPAPAPTSPMPEEPMTPTPPSVVTRATTIVPTWSGTHRAGAGWGRWNVARYTGPRDLYQGSTATSGQLRGLATYGAQITALSPTSIIQAILTTTGNGTNHAFTAVLQAATHTGDGPATTGPTVTAAVSGTATTRTDITALAEGLLAGAGLALVGNDYGAVAGVGASMSIELTYEAES